MQANPPFSLYFRKQVQNEPLNLERNILIPFKKWRQITVTLLGKKYHLYRFSVHGLLFYFKLPKFNLEPWYDMNITESQTILSI